VFAWAISLAARKVIGGVTEDDLDGGIIAGLIVGGAAAALGIAIRRGMRNTAAAGLGMLVAVILVAYGRGEVSPAARPRASAKSVRQDPISVGQRARLSRVIGQSRESRRTRMALQNRRSFVSVVASLAGVAAFQSANRVSAQSDPLRVGQFDMTWLDQMKGRHKQVYDFGSQNLAEDPAALRFCRNFLDTFRDTYQLGFPDVNTAVGISGPAFPMNASDRLWAKYKLGERSKIIDPMTGQPAVRNIFLDTADVGVKALQARGTVFWQCNVALGVVARQLAQANNMPVDEVRADLAAGLNPGVHLMPSHVMALALAQERGFSYMKP
jgi:intracellular sulfur oxidation DsrE/DsrF family protein